MNKPADTPPQPQEPDVVPLDDPNVPASLVPIPRPVPTASQEPTDDQAAMAGRDDTGHHGERGVAARAGRVSDCNREVAVPTAEPLDLAIAEAAREAATRIRFWLVQSHRYTASTLELDKRVMAEISTAMRARLRAAGAVAPPVIGALGWQPIESYDKAQHPLDVLVATTGGVGEARQHDDGAYGRWFWANTCDDGAPGPGQIFPTHWMPLPAPPEVAALRDTPQPKSSRDTPHAYEPDVYQGSPCRVCRLEPNHHLHRMRREVGALRDTAGAQQAEKETNEDAPTRVGPLGCGARQDLPRPATE